MQPPSDGSDDDDEVSGSDNELPVPAVGGVNHDGDGFDDHDDDIDDEYDDMLEIDDDGIDIFEYEDEEEDVDDDFEYDEGDEDVDSEGDYGSDDEEKDIKDFFTIREQFENVSAITLDDQQQGYPGPFFVPDENKLDEIKMALHVLHCLNRLRVHQTDAGTINGGSASVFRKTIREIMSQSMEPVFGSCVTYSMLVTQFPRKEMVRFRVQKHPMVLFDDPQDTVDDGGDRGKDPTANTPAGVATTGAGLVDAGTMTRSDPLPEEGAAPAPPILAAAAPPLIAAAVAHAKVNFDSKLMCHILECLGALVQTKLRFNKYPDVVRVDWSKFAAALEEALELFDYKEEQEEHDDSSVADKCVEAPLLNLQQLPHIQDFLDTYHTTEGCSRSLIFGRGKLFQNSNFTVRVSEEWYPLLWACAVDGVTLAEFLDILGGDDDKLRKPVELMNRSYVLHFAVSGRHPNTEIFREILRRVPESANYKDKDGDGLLHYAVLYSHDTTLQRYIIENYPELLTTKGSCGRYPIHILFDNGDMFETIKPSLELLLQHATPEMMLAKDKYKRTLLVLACCSDNPRDPELVRMVLSANPTAAGICDDSRMYPLHYVLGWGAGYRRRERGNDPKDMIDDERTGTAVQMLLEAFPGALKEPFTDSRTALFLAVRNTPLSVIKRVYEADPEVIKVVNRNNGCVLHSAVENPYERREIVSFLLEKHPSLIKEIITTTKRTVLLTAILAYRPDSVLVETLAKLYPEAIPMQDNTGESSFEAIARSYYMHEPSHPVDWMASEYVQMMRSIIRYYPSSGGDIHREVCRINDAQGNYHTLSPYSHVFKRLMLCASPTANITLYHSLNYAARREAMFLLYSTAAAAAMSTFSTPSPTTTSTTSSSSEENQKHNSSSIWWLLRAKGDVSIIRNVVGYL